MSAGRKVIWGVLALLLVLLLGGAFAFWRYPVELAIRTERRALASAGFTTSVIPSSAGPMTMWEAGSGPVVVLLHGAGDQAGAWSKVAPALTGKYRVLIPDLPGHAQSAPSEGPLPVGTILGGVVAVVQQKAGSEPVILVGNSLGGWLAMLYAREHPERVARIVAVNGGALLGRQDVSLVPANREEARRLMALLRDPGSPQFPGFVLDDVVRRARTGPIGRMYATAADMMNYLLDGKLHEVQTPVDLLWGESDELMSLEYAHRMEAQLTAPRLTTLPRCGHIPLRECPVALTDALKKLLQQPPPAPRPLPPKAGAIPPAAEKKK